ncbi:diguanylate cyclase [uncultured Cohaesibacter sp.]|uniref:GGDEF domain-containing protein n=1 Tax=uncultured Cohaesibacter sp. TaxID=1002546 RepID=UPI0029C708F8|nr:diguanylate cyclase [uncultured Cohaesibacter sp.]
MKSRLYRLLVITICSVLISVLVTALLMHFIFGNIPVNGLAIAALVPILAGLPITLALDFQRRKLNDALADLRLAHMQLEKLNLELEKQARYDFMTGFLNRRYFIAAVRENCRKGNTGAILCIDVDNFKQINDSFGHLVGDEALRKIAQSMSSVLAMSSALGEQALIARMGGEEFAIFLQKADRSEAYELAERVRKAVERMPFAPAEGAEHGLSVSIGVALANGARDFETLFGEADLRMYAAKRQGKNRTILPDASELGRVA